jgi:LmbE family N-acetylglucosaminyl deacetylase
MAEILVVAAHPDDEALGCGGTIARHADAGDVVRVLFMTDGVGARGGGDDAARRERRQAAEGAAAILGITAMRFHDFPDNALDTVPLLRVAQAIEAIAGEHPPHTVYTHFGHDLNIDHRIVFQAVMTAFRPQPHCSVRRILCFETRSSTEWAANPAALAFQPNHHVEITATLARKRAALEAYAAEMRPAPHARSLAALEALAMLRGAEVGVAAAEAFVLVREIVRS